MHSLNAMVKIILAVRKMMLEAPSLIDVSVPEDGLLTVCGDVHGKKDIVISEPRTFLLC